MRELPLSVTRAFAVPGAFAGAAPLGNGHIHRTLRARYVGPDGAERTLVHQALNTTIFRDPQALMRNVARVCEHVRAGIADARDAERRALRVVPTRDGASLYVDEQGTHWRTFDAIDRATSHERLDSVEQAESTALVFARFVARLEDLPGGPLTTTIPHFHDTPKRWSDLETAIARDATGRARDVAAEIAHARATFARLELEAEARGVDALPVRTVHNDCKLDNLLFDDQSGEPLCVIDLDTVMDGTLLADLGELVRTSACDAPEDTTEPDAMRIDETILAALARGYVRGAEAFITPGERRALPVAGPLLAFENGIRFLADHLDGDAYFRIHRAGQNLDRARAQLRLADLLLEQMDVVASEVHD